MIAKVSNVGQQDISGDGNIHGKRKRWVGLKCVNGAQLSNPLQGNLMPMAFGLGQGPSGITHPA